ncbi:unnamed protein product [Eruca vesicaria subsp. sativa]|uniref:Cupin type-1 domain-containing protein n=1 Tax=Eruca vesicaria subsp. sativa TaxID=29727 RepID=A0ABC8KJ12_ERUVS|nr:unnamed protein product [Eruca vesicaria subsp. sativa]
MSKFTIIQLCLLTLFVRTNSFSDPNDGFQSPLLIKRHQRTQLVATEFGEISAVHIGDGYIIQFITLEPNGLLLPLLLHSDMVFFVHTGSGVLNWIDEEKERTLELKRGDVFRLRYGTVFYLHCNLERDEVPDKLRVYAIFDVGKCLYDPCLRTYSSIRDLLWGFDERTLRSAFAVPEDVFGRLRDAVKPPLITNAMPRNRTQGLEEETWGSRLAKLFVRVEDVTDHLEMKPVVNSKKKKKKKSSAYNVFESDPDFENVHGQSIVVDEKDMDALKGSSFGVYMVNLTKGSMMAPHWNPNAWEISIVLQGEGMIRVVNNPSHQSKNDSERFKVEDGDVFVVPQFYPMAQLSFINSSFMFMGFSTSAKKNHPQFLVGQNSVLKMIDRDVLATSFNMRYETIERLLGAQKDSLMLECVSCAEVELSRLMREIEERKRREEEEIERRRKEEEEARKREEEREREEEAAKRREEERRRREDEEAERKRKAEEEARKRAEEREREEEAARKREEDRRQREEEEAERKKKAEEEARKRAEEREREQEAARRREEERRQREEHEAERKRKAEEEARKREEAREREEEEAKKQEEERIRREKEKEAARKRKEEREREEEMAKRREEERQRKEREEVERKKREEQERKKREEEAMRREEERKREEEAAKRAEEERRKREEKRRPPPQPPIDH